MKFRLFALIIPFMLALITGCSQIETGNVGVVKTWGKWDMDERLPGVSLSVVETVYEVTTKEVGFQVNDLKPKAFDNLTIADLDVDVYFKINPQLAADTMVKYQGDVIEYGDLVKDGGRELVVGFNRVSREAREAAYKGVAQFPATTMHTKRAELSAEIQRTLQAELDKTDKNVWVVSGVNVRNLLTDPGIENSIRAAAETDQAIARANKEKQLAAVMAEKELIIAQGTAAANRALAESLTPQLVRLKEIEAQKAFAGAGTHTVLMQQGSSALVNVGK